MKVKKKTLLLIACIALFYSGLGVSLFLAGILFGKNYYKVIIPK